MITLRGRFAPIDGHVGRWSCCAAVVLLLMSLASGCSEQGAARERQSALEPTSQAPSKAAIAATPVAAPAKKVATRSVGVRSDAARHTGESLTSPTVPAWAADAVFYQIFPERFCNGDRSNDPTRESLESPELVPKSWAISPWTGDWYARADWEKERGPNFFENGVFDRRYGGDLQGVISKLDYLSGLGINVIYLNPVFYARSLHKYDGSSFHHVDPYFGPDPPGDLKADGDGNERPGQLEMDGCGQAVSRSLEEGARAEYSRDHRRRVQSYGPRFLCVRRSSEAAGGVAVSRLVHRAVVRRPGDAAERVSLQRLVGHRYACPSLRTTTRATICTPGPKKYIFDSTKRWMDPNGDGDPSDGIDGWRLDVANEVPTGFWRDWHALARKINPQCYTVAEIWDDAQRFLDEGQFSATMNYYGFSFPVKGFLIDETLAPSGAAR